MPKKNAKKEIIPGVIWNQVKYKLQSHTKSHSQIKDSGGDLIVCQNRVSKCIK